MWNWWNGEPFDRRNYDDTDKVMIDYAPGWREPKCMDQIQISGCYKTNIGLELHVLNVTYAIWNRSADRLIRSGLIGYVEVGTNEHGANCSLDKSVPELGDEEEINIRRSMANGKLFYVKIIHRVNKRWRMTIVDSAYRCEICLVIYIARHLVTILLACLANFYRMGKIKSSVNFRPVFSTIDRKCTMCSTEECRHGSRGHNHVSESKLITHSHRNNLRQTAVWLMFPNSELRIFLQVWLSTLSLWPPPAIGITKEWWFIYQIKCLYPKFEESCSWNMVKPMLLGTRLNRKFACHHSYHFPVVFTGHSKAIPELIDWQARRLVIEELLIFDYFEWGERLLICNPLSNVPRSSPQISTA